MKKHLFDVKVEQKKKYLSKKRDYIIAIYKHSRTEYKKIRPFLERGIRRWGSWAQLEWTDALRSLIHSGT